RRVGPHRRQRRDVVGQAPGVVVSAALDDLGEVFGDRRLHAARVASGPTAVGISRSSSLTATTPATISAPPISWTHEGSSPSSTQANNTAKSTSVSPMKEATLEPSARAAAMPTAYATAAAITASPRTADHHG